MKDFDRIVHGTLSVTNDASNCIAQSFGSAKIIGEKSDPADRMTETDKRSEEILRKGLTALIPNSSILGEETDDMQQAEWMWIVDPLDGTANFIQGIEYMGISIALQQNGETVLGVLHFPALNDTYTAVQGNGAKRNGKDIRVQDCNTLAEATVAEIFSDRNARGQNVQYPPTRAYRRFGSAITSQAFLARGSVHGLALRCHLWDFAAGKLIIEEAGGQTHVISDTPDNLRGTHLFIAAVPSLFEDFTALIEKNYYPTR